MDAAAQSQGRCFLDDAVGLPATFRHVSIDETPQAVRPRRRLSHPGRRPGARTRQCWPGPRGPSPAWHDERGGMHRTWPGHGRPSRSRGGLPTPARRQWPSTRPLARCRPSPVERFLPSPGIHCPSQQWGSDPPRHYWDAAEWLMPLAALNASTTATTSPQLALPLPGPYQEVLTLRHPISV
jgi:hypothetical protein